MVSLKAGRRPNFPQKAFNLILARDLRPGFLAIWEGSRAMPSWRRYSATYVRRSSSVQHQSGQSRESGPRSLRRESEVWEKW